MDGALRMVDWYAPLRGIASKGSRTDVVGGLAGLAAARAEHQGQFWTPDELVRLMWQVAGLFEPGERCGGYKITILDNSFGCGRMFQFADPKRHRLAGIEVDAEVAPLVQDAADRAGFDRQLEVGSLEQFRHEGSPFDVALVNPPFSVNIDDPAVEDLGVNAYGRYSAHSSVITHRYAVAQALAWSDNVVAIVPRSLADEVDQHAGWRSRHVATLHIPRKVFRSEGAEVDVSILVFGERYGARAEPVVMTLSTLEHEPLLEVSGSYSPGKLSRVGLDTGKPAVTLPVTGDKRVRVAHDGRKVILGFGCGVAQARVMNHVWREKVGYVRKGLRRPDRVQYTGQGQLDLENYLAQPAPLSAFEDFLAGIDALGFESDVDPSVWAWLDRMGKRRALERVPLRHVVNLRDGGFSHWLGEQTEVVGVAARDHEYQEHWGASTKVRAGDQIAFRRCDPPHDQSDSNDLWWKFDHDGRCFLKLTERALTDRFSFPEFEERPNGWTVIHPGLRAAYPDRYHAAATRARALGLHRWCSWGYQFDDLIEVSLKNAIVGWEMGLGKARLAIALCCINGGKYNLISVEPRLVSELREEFAKLEVPAEDWQIVETVEQARAPRRINVISYEKLKSTVKRPTDKPAARVEAKALAEQIDAARAQLESAPARVTLARTVKNLEDRRAELTRRLDPKRLTFADVLRRRIHTHVADEGHLLRNPQTQQTQAVIKVSARRRYLLSGTPIANYPRDVLPLLWWVAGDGICSQVFGNRWSYLRPANLHAIDTAPRGVDEFKEMFVTLEWVTNEFSDNLREGAKREVPKIRDVAGFRAAVAPWVKRRVKEEPDVARHVTFPVPTYHDHAVPWDREHLAFYARTAKEFVNWFKNLPEYQRRGAHLIAILAKIRAVLDACNFPQGGVAGQAKFKGGATSKQRLALELLTQWTAAGHKSILLCESPSVVDWFRVRLDESDIEGVPFHGGIPIKKRVELGLDKRFRHGPAPVLLATKGSLQTGYNIAQACRVLHFDRSWTPTVERQADARVLRPQQMAAVEIHRLGLPGSIDDYQAQMVSAKWSSMSAGLDYGDVDESEVFVHLETILGRFIEDFESKSGPLFGGK